MCWVGNAGNVVGPGVDWTQQVKPATTTVPATAAVLKPAADGSDGVAAGNDAWDAQSTQPQHAADASEANGGCGGGSEQQMYRARA